jgi:ELWxxDGT repeat protein
MKKILLNLCFLASCISANAQASLVADIDTGAANSNPTRLTIFKSMLVFMADDGVNGNELWAMDSTGAHLVFNINPGAAYATPSVNYIGMAIAGGKLYFPADDGTNGNELYSWDGNPANPPVIVNDYHAGATSTNLSELIGLNDKVFFSANDVAGFGQELFVYNPANNVYQRLTDINAGAGNSNPRNFTVYRNKLYFNATSSVSGSELYVYDPTTNATTMVSDINTGVASSDPGSIVVVGNKLYFAAATATKGRELYSMDSNSVITRLTDIFGGTASSFITPALGQTIIGGKGNMIYFSADNGSTGQQLYQYDASKNVASLVYSINPISSSFPSSFINFSNKLYFTAYDGINGTELWVINEKDSVYMAADIDSFSAANPMNFVMYNNALYFSAYSSTLGTELYKYIDPAVGVKNVRFDADVKVYPNPASEQVTIDLTLKNNEQLKLRLFDVTGKEVYHNDLMNYMAGNHKLTVPVRELANGLYFYQVINAAGAKCLSGRIEKQ